MTDDTMLVKTRVHRDAWAWVAAEAIRQDKDMWEIVAEALRMYRQNIEEEDAGVRRAQMLDRIVSQQIIGGGNNLEAATRIVTGSINEATKHLNAMQEATESATKALEALKEAENRKS